MRLFIFIIIPIIAGLIIYLFPNRSVKKMSFGLQSILLALTVYNYVDIHMNGPIRVVLGATESFAGIALYCDKFIAALLILAAFTFFICYLFGLLDKFMNNLFIFLFIVLQALMMTVFMSRDLFNIYVVTEVSTILVAILIMFKKESRAVYDGLFYLISSIAGMAFYLMGTAYLYRIFGVLDIDIIGEQMHLVENTWELALPFAFIITGISLKCAFVPLFSWLPKAYGSPSAPGIVPAVLSGVYAKTGIYLFILFTQMFSPVVNLQFFFLIIGILSGVIGFIFMWFQHDIKMILAYSSISQMGLILTGLSIGSLDSYYGSILHIFNHAVFKSVLFLCAGIIEQRYHTRDIRRMKGVFKDMPIVSIAAIIAILGITGAPLFNGSVSKFIIQEGAGQFAEYAILLINLGTITAFIKFSSIFWGKSKHENIQVDKLKNIAALSMSIMCFIMGFAGPIIIEHIFDYQITIEWIDYLQKTLVFFVSLGIGYFIYYKVINKFYIFNHPRHTRIGINGLALALILYFAVVSLVSYITLI